MFISNGGYGSVMPVLSMACRSSLRASSKERTTSTRFDYRGLARPAHRRAVAALIAVSARVSAIRAIGACRAVREELAGYNPFAIIERTVTGESATGLAAYQRC